jgi:SPP1 gp7 family putative phage head morphogenesis protein
VLLTTCKCTVNRAFVSDRAATVARHDPTGTQKVRISYEAQMVRRFRKLRAEIITAIMKLDVLGLKGDNSLQAKLNTSMFTRLFAPDKTFSKDALPAAKAFAFSSSGDKVASFMQWLKESEQEGILGIKRGVSMASAAQASWQNTYIDSAYQKGIRDAYSYMGMTAPGGSIVSAFNQPMHADRVGIIYTRAYNELTGVTDAMSQSISRVLAQGMADGRGARELASDLADRVDAIGITRARTLVRTEVISAHADGTLNSYEEAGVEGVEVLSEFSTAGDDQVCPDCEDLEGDEYTIDEARGVIPVHPNCRCAWLPVVQDAPAQEDA